MADGHQFTYRFEPGTPGAPTLLLLHGTGGSEHDLIGLGQALLPGAALLSPRGRVLEGGMPRFFRRLAPGVFDQEDLRVRTDELAAFVAEAAAEHGIDAGRIWGVGFSNGANIGASVLLRHPAVLAGAVLFRAMVPFRPATPQGLDGRPVLLAAARHDEMVPVSEAEALAALLSEAGAEVTLEWREGGHGLVAEDLRASSAWLAEHAG